MIVFFFIIFVMICGANKLFKNTCIGKIHTYFVQIAPAKFRAYCTRICPSCCCKNSQEECIGSDGPCRLGVAIFFFIIYFIFATIYIAFVYPRIRFIYKNADFHKNLSIFLLPIPWLLFLYFQIADPGEITADNVDEYLKLFPYDNVIYTPHECQTLHIPVVPRSRFCKFTQKRIAKYDHYCPWVIAPIGYKTHRFFLLFLLSIVNVSAYYSYGSCKLLYRTGTDIYNRLLNNASSTAFVAELILNVIGRELFVIVDAVVLFAIAITMFGFFIQQAIHVSKNMTQIEDEKYSKAKKELGHPIQNIYSKGFWGNWKEELFPPKAVKINKVNKDIPKRKSKIRRK